MLHQVVTSRKLFPASSDRTIVRTLSRVDAHMALQMLLSLESLAAAFDGTSKLAGTALIGDHKVMRRINGKTGDELGLCGR